MAEGWRRLTNLLRVTMRLSPTSGAEFTGGISVCAKLGLRMVSASFGQLGLVAVISLVAMKLDDISYTIHIVCDK